MWIFQDDQWLFFTFASYCKWYHSSFRFLSALSIILPTWSVEHFLVFLLYTTESRWNWREAVPQVLVFSSQRCLEVRRRHCSKSIVNERSGEKLDRKMSRSGDRKVAWLQRIYPLVRNKKVRYLSMVNFVMTILNLVLLLVLFAFLMYFMILHARVSIPIQIFRIFLEKYIILCPALD